MDDVASFKGVFFAAVPLLGLVLGAGRMVFAGAGPVDQRAVVPAGLYLYPTCIFGGTAEEGVIFDLFLKEVVVGGDIIVPIVADVVDYHAPLESLFLHQPDNRLIERYPILTHYRPCSNIPFACAVVPLALSDLPDRESSN